MKKLHCTIIRWARVYSLTVRAVTQLYLGKILGFESLWTPLLDDTDAMVKNRVNKFKL